MEQEQDPDQEKRVLLAVVLSMGLLWFFTTFVLEPPPVPEELPPEAAAAVEATPETPEAVAAPTAAPEAAAAVEAAPPRTIEHATTDLETTLSSFGGSPSEMIVPAYLEHYEQNWLPTWLISGFSNGMKWEPFTLACPDVEPVDMVRDDAGVVFPVGFDGRGIDADGGHYRVVEEGATVAFATRRGDLEITKRYTPPTGGFGGRYQVEFKNVGIGTVHVEPAIGVADKMEAGENRYGPQMEAWAQVEGDVRNYAGKKMAKKPRVFEGEVDWFGVGDRYFLLGLEPTEAMSGTLSMVPTVGEERFASVVEPTPFDLGAGQTKTYAFKMFSGPKSLENIRAAEMNMESAVDFGWFGLLALPILAFLKFIYGLVGSWGLAIILLTVVIKGVLFPLNQRAYRSMKDMQKLQPKIEELKEKYGDDREAMNVEMMKLWRENGVNPAGGCLPMVLQMPIWFALYRVLWNAVELYQTPFLYFCDLSLQDPIGIFAILLGVSMWLMQKMTPNTASDPTQQMVIKFMPIFMAVIMFTLPAGLVVYILVNNVLSIGQQWLIHRQHGGPSKPATT
jgi:YidC/Oxa1 family membrane protein insertase